MILKKKKTSERLESCLTKKLLGSPYGAETYPIDIEAVQFFKKQHRVTSLALVNTHKQEMGKHFI